MAVATTTGAFLAGLKTALAARMVAAPGLGQVEVQLVPPRSEDVPLGDFLYLIRGPIVTSDRLATARKQRARDEDAVIPGAVQAYEISPSGGDDAFQAAFDRAEDILDQLIEQLRDDPPQVGEQTRSAIVQRIRWTPMAQDKGGWVVRGDYELKFSSRVP